MMLKALRKLRGKPVVVELEDAPTLGGGIELGQRKAVLLFLDADSLWAAFQWRWSSQVVIIPRSNVVCIAADLQGSA